MHSVFTELIPGVVRWAAQTSVAGLWQGIVGVALMAAILRLLPRAGAAFRFRAWTLLFLALMAASVLHARTGGADGVADVVGASDTAAWAPVHLDPRWGYEIAALWAALMCVRGVQLGRQALRLRAMWRSGEPMDAPAEIRALLRDGRRPMELCTSVEVESPSVIGFFAPRLLLPASLAPGLTTAELRQIALHERGHLRRNDDWWNLLFSVGLVLFPLNPALVWVKRLTTERELACDAEVVASTRTPLEYASCLMQVAEHRTKQRMGHEALALPMAASSRRSEMSLRIESLLHPVRSMPAPQARVAIALLAVGVAGGAVGLTRAPQVVSFADIAAAPVAQAAMPVEVGSHPPGTVRATLLKAELPEATVPAEVEVKRSAPVRSAAKEDVPVNGPRQVRVKAIAEPSAVRSLRVTGERRVVRSFEVVPVEYSSSYAAVPFGDGWLIVQL